MKGHVGSSRCWATSLASVGMLGASIAACDGGFALDNGLPRVTWVAVEPVADDRAALTLWVKDAEGDAVDVAITWSVGGQSGPLALAPGSAPLVGLPTQLGLTAEDGQAHRVLWDLTGVPEGAATFELTVDDRPHAGSDGDVYRTAEGLDPRAGGGPVAALR